MTLSQGDRLAATNSSPPSGPVGWRGCGGRATRLGRDVAIEELLPQVADGPDRRKRFERETTRPRFNHPNLLAVHDVGIDHDQTLCRDRPRR